MKYTLDVSGMNDKIENVIKTLNGVAQEMEHIAKYVEDEKVANTEQPERIRHWNEELVKKLIPWLEETKINLIW